LKPFAPNTQMEFRVGMYGITGSQTTGGADVDLLQTDMTGRYLTGPMTIGFESHTLNLDTTSGVLPRQLNDQSVALGYDWGDFSFQRAGTWSIKTIAGVGFAGNKAYQDSDGLYLRGDIIGIKKIDAHQQWQISLNYDGNRSFVPDLPIPTVSYLYFDQHIQYMIGLPYSSITYHFNEKTQVHASSLLFTSLNLRLEHRFHSKFSAYASYTSDTRMFMIKAPTGRDRISFEQTRVEIGINHKMADQISLNLAYGYAFNQTFEQGYDAQDLDPITDLDDEHYLKIGFEIGF